MNDYYLIRFEMSPCDGTEGDILAALLCEVGFESFVPDSSGVSAYIRKEDYDRGEVERALSGYEFHCSMSMTEELIPGQDWNSEWEKNYFQPIVIGDRCVIHSSFHRDYPSAEYDIMIDPRMAFGTGHHETTSMMVERLLGSDVRGKSLLDMGTGTGILAILAAKLGAGKVVGVEIDPPAFENAVDNMALNGVPQVELRLGGAETVSEKADFDFVLANINRNIILADIASYAAALKPGGRLVLSGFYTDDIPVVEKRAAECGLRLESTAEKKRWANLCLVKN